MSDMSEPNRLPKLVTDALDRVVFMIGVMSLSLAIGGTLASKVELFADAAGAQEQIPQATSRAI